MRIWGSEELNSILESITNQEFVVKLVGATDIFRKQQILSQQSQKIDQLVSEVYDNIKIQRDKLCDPNDWSFDDINNLDELNWAETRKCLGKPLKTTNVGRFSKPPPPLIFFTPYVKIIVFLPYTPKHEFKHKTKFCVYFHFGIILYHAYYNIQPYNGMEVDLILFYVTVYHDFIKHIKKAKVG